MNEIANWLRVNVLTLYIEKTKYMIFQNKK